ncbi:hypothetical protein [Vibrio sp. 99-8-1]|nr:hypothetical protein [Vibrio sp. 99-8-1]
MNANLSAILKAGIFMLVMYYAAAYLAILPELLYMFGLELGLF